ncbi:MAG: hypothetical protein JRF63_14625, partial [Deltaproteobacteria bacterium]|nr:hypothetical protein [Deltaproteobacteria bacterium]
DTDTDTDTDTGCGDVPEFCCNEDCPCGDVDARCIYPLGLSENGVCKDPPLNDGECWGPHDCEYGEVCDGAVVCACDYECFVEDSPGTCIWGGGTCCSNSDPPDPCASGYFCMELGGTDTCHAEIEHPACWTDDDCDADDFGNCVGAAICPCDYDCLSEVGICDYF